MSRLTADEARCRFLSSPVARLATVSAAGEPHLVPVTFAPAASDTLLSAVDHKPKATTALVRLANIAANPAVTLLVDRYDEDWSALWWARADGHATVLEPGVQQPGSQQSAHSTAIAHLVARYHQYRDRPPAGPVIEITVARWSGWQWAD